MRGQRLDHLQVYDHRRERAGFVRSDAVRRIDLAPAQADELLAVLRFLRNAPGQEALGIAYVAAWPDAPRPARRPANAATGPWRSSMPWPLTACAS